LHERASAAAERVTIAGVEPSLLGVTVQSAVTGARTGARRRRLGQVEVRVLDDPEDGAARLQYGRDTDYGSTSSSPANQALLAARSGAG